jgi:hypothetical protein
LSTGAMLRMQCGDYWRGHRGLKAPLTSARGAGSIPDHAKRDDT